MKQRIHPHCQICKQLLIATFSIVFIFLFSFSAIAKKNKITASADKAFENHKYIIAADKYSKALKKIKGDLDKKDRINYQIAICYRLTNNYRRAMNQFKRMIRANYQEKEPLVLLYYAESLKLMEDYEEAIIQYRAYQLLIPEDKRAENGIRACDSIHSWLENPTKHQIENLSKINSRESDFAPTYGGRTFNTLIFTSTREDATGKETDEWTDQEFSDLFISRVDRQGGWSKPVLLDNEDGDIENNNTINTIANEGAPTMNKNFTQMYFTRCPNAIKKASGCQIYTSKRVSRTWSRPQILMLGRDTSIAVGHPSLSSDEKTIYFSAERSGGAGGKDIWYATRKSRESQFGRPQNLGPRINTPGDEVFPFLRNDTLLYFSSNGHISMGGLDIFVSELDENNDWGIVANMKSPMNSNLDDFGIVFHDEREEGFFSSNRKGSKGDDVYSFQIPPVEFTITGLITNRETGDPLEGVKVSLIGSNGSLVSVRSNTEGYYEFGITQVSRNLDYELKLNEEEFFSSTETINTRAYESSFDFKLDFMLQPIPEEPIVLPDILYDFAKWDLKPQYQDSLQGLIRTLEENENLVIELASHTDSRDTEERNDVLSQRRASSVVDYLILRGINSKRLVPKGYGESQPRDLKKDFIREGLTFRANTILSEDFINSLENTVVQEAAHQLNRRTEFKVLRTDFDPFAEILGIDASSSPTGDLKPKRRILQFNIDEQTNETFANCTFNDHDFMFIYKEDAEAEIPLREALKLLNTGAITKDDFFNQDDLKYGTIANGSELYIKELSIAGKVVRNLPVKVNNRIKEKLIIGESTLIMFGLFNFDPENQIIIFK
jgi:peptidoglycan-associated lipoprotein